MPFVEKYLNACANVLIKDTSIPIPTTYYLGLSLTNINADGSGITEPDVSSGYARLPITINSTNFTVAMNGVISNAQSLTMSTIISDSGTAIAWFIAEESVGPAVIYGVFDSPRQLAANSTIYVNPGELKFGVQNL